MNTISDTWKMGNQKTSLKTELTLTLKSTQLILQFQTTRMSPTNQMTTSERPHWYTIKQGPY